MFLQSTKNQRDPFKRFGGFRIYLNILNEIKMDFNKFNEFRKRIESSLSQMDAKISFLYDGVKGLGESHKGFQEEMSDFMSFMAEGLADHESRISTIEEKIK